MGEKVRRGQLTYWISLKDGDESGDSRLQRYSSTMDSVPYFCTTANMQSAIIYLSQELQGMGLGCPLIDTEGQRVNLVALVNACWEVTQLYRASVRDTNALHDQNRRNTADINHFQTSIRDLRGEVNEKERMICEAQEKERRANTDSKSLAAKLKQEKEEVRRLSSVLQQREAQYQHELKKKEVENTHLQDRLHRLISGGRSSNARPSTMTLSVTLPRENRSRAKWKTEASSARHEEELYKRVLSHYETWVGQLNDENDQLKSTLLRMSSQMAKVKTKYCKVDTQELLEGDMNTSMTSAFSADSLENLITNLEFPAYKDQLQATFNENMRAVVHSLEEATLKTDSCDQKQLKEELEDLRKQLKTATDELASYRFAVEKYKTEEAGEKESSFLVEGRHIEDEVSLERERQKLMKEREILEKEKKIFTEATIKLNRERAFFEAEKADLLKEQFLQDLPPTLDADLAAGGHESGGSLSSGGIGEMFDSTRCLVSVPNLTSPSGNITFIEGSPVVLGPSRLSKQQHDLVHGASSKMNYGFKSAPASRASSTSRQCKEKDHTHQGQHGASGIRPLSTRPRTLERTRHKAARNTRTPLSRTRSHSQGNLAKDGAQTDEEDETFYKYDALNSTVMNLQGHRDYLDDIRRDGLFSEPLNYPREVSLHYRECVASPQCSPSEHQDSPQRTSRQHVSSPQHAPMERLDSPQRTSRKHLGSPQRAPREHVGSPQGSLRKHLDSPQRAVKERLGSLSASPRERLLSLSASPREHLGTPQHAPRERRGSLSASPREHLGTPQHAPKERRGSLSASPRERLLSLSASPREHLGSPQHAPRERRGSPSASPMEHLLSLSASPREHLGSPQHMPRECQGSLSASPRERLVPLFAAPREDLDSLQGASREHGDSLQGGSRECVDSVQPTQRMLRPDIQSQESLHETNIGSNVENSSVRIMESDLADLMKQLGLQQDTTAPSCPDNPSSYSTSTPQKSKPKPKVLSLFKSAPINLFSSRRSSQDLSDTEHSEKRKQKPPKKSGH